MAAGDIACMASRHRGCEPGDPERKRPPGPEGAGGLSVFVKGRKPRKRKRGCNKSPYNEFKPRSDHVGPGGAFGWPLGGGEKGGLGPRLPPVPHLRLGVGEGVQLPYVVPRRDEPELQGALLQAPEGEPREAEVPLDVAEDR